MRHALPSTILLGLLLAASVARAELYTVVIQGLGGTEEYQSKFTAQRERIVAAASASGDAQRVTGLSGEEASRDALMAFFGELESRMTPQDRAAIYLIGHGSYDGVEYKFNIPGPDISGQDLGGILANLPGDNHFLVNTSSTSGAILETLEGEDRIIVTATRNGNERNATEFGVFFAESLSSEEADINKNNTISVQEAFDYAARKVEDFYSDAGKLATEHPQLRGDGAERFSLARVTPVAIANDDPALARLQERRLEVESRIETLQLNRDDYSSDEYLQRLQALILEAASISEEIDTLQEGDGPDAP